MTVEHDLFEDDDDPRLGPLAGLAIGKVSDPDDPDKRGRVKVTLPGLTGAVASTWARVLRPAAGAKHGVWWPLEIDDEVLVGFVGGHPELPVVLGGLWSAKIPPPVAEADRRAQRTITTTSGHTIRLDDTPKGEKLEIVAAGGENAITIDVATGALALKARKKLEISVGDVKLTIADGKVELSCDELVIAARTDVTVGGDAVTIDAGQDLALSGGKSVNVNNGALTVEE